MPWPIAIGPNGNVYVGDGNNERIEVFTTSGTYLSQWGNAGSGNGQFDGPRGIAGDSHGNVYVVDEYNNRVERFDANGTYLTQWDGSDSPTGQFAHPLGVAVDARPRNERGAFETLP